MFNLWGEIAEHGTSVIWKKEKKISFIEWAEIEELYPNLVPEDCAHVDIYEESLLITENPFARTIDSKTRLPSYWFHQKIPKTEFELTGAINYRGLIDSMSRREFDGYILTCGCSVPGCAGFWEEYCHVSNKMVRLSINKYQVYMDLFFERERYEQNVITMFRDLIDHKTGWDNLACPSYRDFESFRDHVMWMLDQRPYYHEMWDDVEIAAPYGRSGYGPT